MRVTMASMQIWNLGGESGSGDLSIGAVRLLLDGLTSGDPAANFHAFLCELAPVDYLTHVRYVERHHGTPAPPELLAGHAAPDLRNTTAQCFAIYRERFWKQDECTSLAERLRVDESSMALVHFTPGDVSAPAWRRTVYARMQIEDRLTLVYSAAPGAVFGLNLYRTRRHGPFNAAEIERVRSVAPLVRQVHGSFLAASGFATPVLALRLERVSKLLRERIPELSPREGEVCARIALGMSADGIAADLRVSVSSVTTLRKRAYAKLRLRGIEPGRGSLASLGHLHRLVTGPRERSSR